MNYSEKPGYCRVDIHKPGGKYYTTIVIDMSESYNQPLIGEEFRKAVKIAAEGHFDGMWAICQEPYHVNAHPQMWLIGSETPNDAITAIADYYGKRVVDKEPKFF